MKILVTVTLFLLTFVCLGSIAEQANQEVLSIESFEPLEITHDRTDLPQQTYSFELEE